MVTKPHQQNMSLNRLKLTITAITTMNMYITTSIIKQTVIPILNIPINTSLNKYPTIFHTILQIKTIFLTGIKMTIVQKIKLKQIYVLR